MSDEGGRAPLILTTGAAPSGASRGERAKERTATSSGCDRGFLEATRGMRAHHAQEIRGSIRPECPAGSSDVQESHGLDSW